MKKASTHYKRNISRIEQNASPEMARIASLLDNVETHLSTIGKKLAVH